jgi:hypothetical protein
MRRPEDNGKWDKPTSHYQVMIYQEAPHGLDNPRTLKFERERFELVSHYSKGSGHKGRPPQLDEVLNSLRLDAEHGQESFENFCWSLGYDPDSRRAFQTWQSCQEIARQLAQLLDPQAREILATIEYL